MTEDERIRPASQDGGAFRWSDACVSDERLKRALLYVAHLVLTYGDKIAPVLYRLEAELAARQHEGSAQDRARAVLERYGPPE